MNKRSKRNLTNEEAFLRRVAVSFDVGEDVLQRALRKQDASSSTFLQRTDDVRKGLEHELGGNDELKVWLRTENVSLDDRRPIEFLEDGRIDILERVQKALKGLQFG